jgi:hypothetical protein
MFLFCSRAKGKGKQKQNPKLAPPLSGPRYEKLRVLFLGHTFWMQDQIVIGQARYFEAIEVATSH